MREADWIEGWSPGLVVSTSGFAERDCVFTTADANGDAIWYVTEHDPERRHLQMIKIVPGVTACRLVIDVAPAAAGSAASVRYTHTSLGPAGDAVVADFTAEAYRLFMDAWELRLNHYLRHGTRLADAGHGSARPTESGLTR